MHTKLPEFIKGMKKVSEKHCQEPIHIRGLENIRTCNMQSLRTGRIEFALEEVAKESARVELVVLPRVPETMHTVVVKGFDNNGKPTRAILEVINILHPTEDVELTSFANIEDRRPELGKH